MLKRIDELLAAKVSFSIETTLATRSYTRLIKRAQSEGYKVSLIYFWLNSPELAVNRVLQRVNEGGHNVPLDVIYRRYQAGINNLFQIIYGVCGLLVTGRQQCFSPSDCGRRYPTRREPDI